MIRGPLLVAVAAVVAVVVTSGLSGCPARFAACNTDADCAEGTLCTLGLCRAPEVRDPLGDEGEGDAGEGEGEGDAGEGETGEGEGEGEGDVDPGEGTCDSPFTATLGSRAGDTSAFPEGTRGVDGCPANQLAPENTFAFTAAGAGVLHALLTSDGFDAALSVREVCDDIDTEIDCDSSPPGSALDVDVFVDAGDTVFLFVDGRENEDDAGPYVLDLDFEPQVCGDGDVIGTEDCDSNDLDGASCAGLGFASGTLACNATCDGFVTTSCVPAVCGDGVAEAAEECDGADLNGATCGNFGFDVGTPACSGCQFAIGTCASVCGNGALGAGEACDDGNLVDGDGCSSTCTIVGPTLESERNDDGAVAIGGGNAGNDFLASAADGPFTGDVLVQGALSPAGDEDIYAITNATLAAVDVRLETHGGNPDSCAGDTVINVRDAAGALRASDDDSGGGVCSRLVVSLAPSEELFVQVLRFGDSATIGTYFLQIDFP